MSRNIFVKKPVKCPVCQTQYELKYPNPKLYAASSRDDDERVTGYSWTLGIKTAVLPHHYSVLQCPGCLYADFLEKLEKPGYSSKERGLYKAIEQLPQDRKLLLRKLRRLVPEEGDYNLETAFALHLASIYINLLPGDPKIIDHLALGRLYLRLSWLYREQNGDVVKTPQTASSSKVKKSSIMTQLSKTGEKLEETLQESLDLLGEFRGLSKKRTRELELPAEKNPYAKTVNEIESNLEMAFQDLSKLESIVVQDRNRILMIKEKGEVKEAETQNQDNEAAPALDGLLPSLTAIWPQLPQDEAAAVRLATEAFDFSFKHEEVGQNIQQSNAIGLVMLQLLQRTADLDRALEYAVQLYKTAFRDKQSLQMTLTQGQKDNSMEDAEIKETNRMLAAVTNSLNKAGESRKYLLEQIYERDKDKILQVLKNINGGSMQEQVQSLLQAGFSEEIVTFLRDRHILKTDGQKKKWFGK